MMRVAYISADQGVPVFGRKGCSIHVQEVIRALAGRGIEVDLFSPRGEGTSPPGLESVTVHGLPALAVPDRAARERAAIAANGALHAALEQEGPFDMVYERYSLWSFAGMEYARAARVPGLLEVNAPLIEEQAEHRGLVDRAGAHEVAQRVFTAANAIVAVSDEVKRYLGQYGGAARCVHVIQNGVNPDRFPPDLAPSGPGAVETFTVGFVGSLKPWHGLATLAEAFALFHRDTPKSRLLIVGDGPEWERLLEDLSGHGVLEATHLTGSVAPEQVPGLLASLDVGVAPYPASQGFYFSPLKVYEYMAAALPVVASRIGQLAELIEHDVNGLLCPPGDTVALAGALERLHRDPAARKRLGQAARATVLHRYTWDRVVDRILGLAKLATPTRYSREEVLA
jgi:glycosyltransferase involved in cell wall biosynthesis